MGKRTVRMMERKGGFSGSAERIKVPSFFDLPPSSESSPEFKTLREDVLRKNKQEVIERISSNPVPDAEELSAGAYREMIEPQCREAIFTMRRKGYDTGSSGFGSGNAQIVDGRLPLTQAVVDSLAGNGFMVYEVGVNSPSISFRPKNPDMSQITETWNQLAELLPDLGSPALPRHTSRASFYKGIMGSLPDVPLVQTFMGGLRVRPSR